MSQKRRPVPVPPPPRVEREEPPDTLETAQSADATEISEPTEPPAPAELPRHKATVEVPRRFLNLLLGMLVVALVAVAFLVGRETSRSDGGTAIPPAIESGQAAPQSSAPGPATFAPAPASGRRAAAPAAPPAAAPRTSVASPTQRQAPAPRPFARQTAPASPAAADTGIDPRVRESLARYFSEVDAMGGAGMSGDPEEVANAIVSEGASGNFGSFDEITRTQRSNLMRMQQMSVPPEARDYHAKTIDLMQAGIEMMDAVRKGMESGDVFALTSLSARAQTMQGEAEEAARLGAAIKAEYGLP